MSNQDQPTHTIPSSRKIKGITSSSGISWIQSSFFKEREEDNKD